MWWRRPGHRRLGRSGWHEEGEEVEVEIVVVEDVVKVVEASRPQESRKEWLA